jgi:hypothetical protein
MGVLEPNDGNAFIGGITERDVDRQRRASHSSSPEHAHLSPT